MSEDLECAEEAQQEEDADTNILTGEVLTPQQRQRLFGNIGALCDYVRVFGISGGQFGMVMQGDKVAYALVYNTNN